MSKLKLTFLTTFLFAVIGGQSVNADNHPEVDVADEVSDECELPTAPIIPDGNVASQDELLAAQKAMKGFQAVLVDYRLCIDEKSALLDLETEEGAAAKLVNNQLYDASVTAEESVAEKFNLAVRAFKSRGS